MSAMVLIATIAAVLRVYAGHPYRVHILAAVLALVAVECLALALLSVVRSRR